MPVRIPTYESRLTPSGQGIQARASAVNVSDAIGRGLQNLGQAGMNVANIMQDKEDADAIANTGTQLADANGYWSNKVNTLAQSSRDGGIVQDKEGQSIGMTNQLQNEFESWKTDFLAGITNKKAQQYAQQHITSLWSGLYDKSLTTQAALDLQNRSDKVDQSTAKYAQIVSTNPESVEQYVKDVKTQIANSNLDSHTAYVKALAAEKTIRESALMSSIQRDPQSVKSAIEQHYGSAPEGVDIPIDVNKSWESAIEFTLQHEGSAYVAHDANGHPVKYGINQGANPDVDVKNLTREQAAKIYKDRYWDKIGGDELAKTNPAIATLAFDTAVVGGVARAKDFLKKSGGDANKFLQLRQEYLDGLVNKDPEKFGFYAKAWGNRNADLLKDIQTKSQPANSALNTLITGIEPDRLPTFLNTATSELNKQQAVYRSQLTTTETSHSTMFVNGDMPSKLLSEQEYIKAYGPIEGVQRFAEYTKNAQLGSDISTLKTMPVEQMDVVLTKYKPDPSKPNYDLQTARYQSLVNAADAVNTARKTDPMLWAVQSNIADNKPLNFADTNTLRQQLSNRSGIAATMQNKYGAPLQLLTKAEAQSLSQNFGKMNTNDKLAYLNVIHNAVPDQLAYRSIMQQVSPDSPVTAIAGVLVSKQAQFVTEYRFQPDTTVSSQNVAAIVLEGEALLNPTKTDKAEGGTGKTFPMPSETDFVTQFNSEVGDAFANNAEAANIAYQAVKSYYAGQSARKGDLSGSMEPNRIKSAIKYVLGGVTNVNGNGKTLRPWGMPEETFKDQLKVKFDAAMAANGYQNTQYNKFDVYTVQSYGDSTYLLRIGNQFLLDKAGKPIILNLAQGQPAQQSMPISRPAATTQNIPAKPVTTQLKTK